MDVATANPAFDGGALTNKAATATFTNITTSDTDNGISVLTKGTAGRAAVQYNGAVSGWVEKEDNNVASAAVAASTWDGTTYYITGVTVPTDKTFTVTTQADTALDSTSTLTINNSANRQVSITNNGSTAVTSGANNAGNVTISAYANGSAATAENAQTVITNGIWNTNSVNPSTAAQGPYYGKTTVSAVSQTNLSAENVKYNT